MKIYLVGGAVRDKLLGHEVDEKDWVVVGATAEEMLQQGFRQVGKDFPVFLHPKTQEEYALARTERKIGKGYTGFSFHASPEVTLEEDLKRRDLTINAMAETMDGQLIDPYRGKNDLEKKLLRHVSNAFVEDPVRILRVARFAARLEGFVVADETNQLMQEMVHSGEVNALVPERVWKEFERALSEDHPEQFFQVLAECSALPTLFPQIKLSSKGMQALVEAAEQSEDTRVRFAALLHDLTLDEINKLCEHYRIPNDYRELAILVATFLPQFIQASQLSTTQIVELLQSVDAFRREARFLKFLKTCDACAKIPSSLFLLKCLHAAQSVDATQAPAHLRGKEIADWITQERIKKIGLM